MRVALVSLKFSPGHVAHISAYQKLFSLICDEVIPILHPAYQSFLSDIPGAVFTERWENVIKARPDRVLVYNICIDNIKLARACRKQGIPMLYVLHEPMCRLADLIKEGKNFPKAIVAQYVNWLICANSYKVLMASHNGVETYERYMRRCNNNFAFFPLVFDDDFKGDAMDNREFFSYIGTFCEAHGGKEFVRFAEYVLQNKRDIKLLIATKTNVDNYLRLPVFQQARADGRLTVQSGRIMTTQEINTFYRRSICVWNAYNRSTQSGVLPNALMQGTPLIVNKNGVAKEVLTDKSAGCFIEMPPDNEQIWQSYCYIKEHLSQMQTKAREIFLEKYFYKAQLNLAKEVILEMK